MKNNLMICVILLLVCSSLNMAEESEQKFTILVTHKDLPAGGMDVLRNNEYVNVIVPESDPPTKEEILRLCPGVDGLLWATHIPLNAEALDAAGPNLKAISTFSAGLDYVDLAEVRRRNIPIGYTPKVLDNAVADITIGLMIAAARRFHEGRLKVENSQWKLHPQWLLGQDIEGSTVGIVGFGSIGQAIAKRLQGFELAKILYSGHRPKPYADKYKAEFVSFDQLLTDSDYVIIAAPLTNETRNLFNAETFAKMKPTSVLINIARGQIVNTNDLITALKTGKIFAAGLDVMDPEPLPADNELLKLPNVVLAPHLGSATVNTRNYMAQIAANNVLRGIGGEPMLAPVPNPGKI